MESDNTLVAQWVVDSETGEEVLMDVQTNKPIMKRIGGKLVEMEEL